MKDVIEEGDRFIAMCVDLDLTYKITDALNYEAARLELIQSLEEMFSERYFFWHFEKAEVACISDQDKGKCDSARDCADSGTG
ncbi:MAG: hypothetical protein ACLU92_06470 [Coprococcus comes]